MSAVRLVGISGSLRQDSNNSKLIEVARASAPGGVRFDVADQPGQLPHFNPDLPIDDPGVLAEWIDLVRKADGLVISSPEYARGYPGTLKNALDWLVQTDAHIDKPFMMLNASNRSTVARDSLIVVLQTMSGIHCEQASVTIPILGKELDLDKLMASEDTTDKIRDALSVFVSHIVGVSVVNSNEANN